jgi:hypothetical protein
MAVRLVKIANNFHRLVDDGPRKTTIWFSYETPVALSVGRGIEIVRENVWGSTTGKHLNQIDGGDSEAKKRRVSGDTFQRYLDAVL